MVYRKTLESDWGCSWNWGSHSPDISLGGMYEPKDLENIDKETEYVLLHESLHWVLGKFVCESASFWLDNENVSEFIHLAPNGCELGSCDI
jgi:hypothetical protein